MKDITSSPAERTPATGGAMPMAAPPESPRTTPKRAIDRALRDLQANKDAWAALGLTERLVILDRVARDFAGVGDRWVAATIEAKGIPADSFGHGEEWAVFGAVLRNIRVVRTTLSAVRRFGRPRLPGPLKRRPDGQVVAPVFPADRYDALSFAGITAETWLDPGISTLDVEQSWKSLSGPNRYTKPTPGRVSLVLGAGNAAVLTPADVLTALFLETQVVILKMHPVNAYLGPFVEEGFAALIERGFLRVIYGGAQEGAYLCAAPAVDTIHLTGSDKTLEAIVFGPGPAGARRKATRKPLIHKPVIAELGGVSPVIVVPGPWSARDLHRQALELASSLASNAGFNCLTPRVIVQYAGWDQRAGLLDELANVLAKVPARKAYYPGAHDRHAAFLAQHPYAMRLPLHPAGDESLPWTLIPNVDPTDRENICFRSEAFCSLFAETALEAQGIPNFIRGAVKFANGTLWGSLVATIVVHPRSLEDPEVAAAVEQAIADLRYGTVCVNLFAGMAYALMAAPWGAFPGHDVAAEGSPYDVGSGIGKVNNFYMLPCPQKAVFRAPFGRVNPFTVELDHAEAFARSFACFFGEPSLSKMPALIKAAIGA